MIEIEPRYNAVITHVIRLNDGTLAQHISIELKDKEDEEIKDKLRLIARKYVDRVAE